MKSPSKSFLKLAPVLALVLALGALLISSAEAKLDSKEWRNLSKKARKQAKMGQYSSLADTIAELAADDSVRMVDMLGGFYRISDGDVFDAVRDALVSVSDDKAIKHMAKKLSKGGGKWQFRVQLADAFARRSDDDTLTALNEAVGDRKDEVQRSVISAIQKRRAKSSIPALIDVLEELQSKNKSGLTVEALKEALLSLTGKDLAKAVDYRSWWDGHKDSFEVPSRATTGKKAKKVEGTAERRPKFFGSEIKSRRIVFVIDVSGSMQATDAGSAQPGRTPTGGKPAPTSGSRVRIERAKFQLAQAIKMLPKDAFFTVLAYHGGGTVPPKGQSLLAQADKLQWLSVFSKKLIPAKSKAAVSKAASFVQNLKPLGATFTFNALRAAFEVPGADNIILLSDGAPNDPKPGASPQPGAGGAMTMGSFMSPAEILKEVKTMNNFRKIRIDTFGFDSMGAMGGRGGSVAGGMQNPFVEFLKRLAKQNNGKFTKIK